MIKVKFISVIMCSIVMLFAFAISYVYAADNTIGIYGGSVLWNDQYGYGGFIQWELEDIWLLKMKSWCGGAGIGLFHAKDSFLSYTMIPFLVTSGFKLRPFAIPFLIKPSVIVGTFLGYRSDDYGNSDAKIGIKIIPALTFRYDFSAVWSIAAISGYSYAYTSEYQMRNVYVMGGFVYRFVISPVNIPVDNDLKDNNSNRSKIQ